jgi:hypothetical protein
VKEEMKKEGRDRGCRETDKVYQRRKMSLEYFIVEEGTKG